MECLRYKGHNEKQQTIYLGHAHITAVHSLHETLQNSLKNYLT